MTFKNKGQLYFEKFENKHHRPAELYNVLP